MDSIIFEACTNNAEYLGGLLVSGLVIGAIYALMALGLTLIFSVLGIVSFAHGQFYMIGGFVTFFLLQGIAGLPWYVALLLAGLTTFVIGAVFEELLLKPMFSGKVERPGEYAILITFGLGFFLQYAMLAIVGPFPVKATRFVNWDIPELFGVTVPPNRAIAATLAIVAIGVMVLYIERTWTGRALRAVSQDKDAAAVTGINPAVMNRLAFGLGCLLAGISGATLVQVFSWVFNVGGAASAKSFVIIVLGGMGSIPGALVAGLIIGVVEVVMPGCWGNPEQALALRDAWGLAIFALILLVRPQGLFGRKL